MSIEYRKPKTLSQLEEENAKLREQIHWLKQGDILHVLTDQEYIDQCEREQLMQVSIDALDDENAKLRELVRDMFLVVACMDLDGSQLHMHGVDADWRTLRERYDELMGYEGEADE